MITGCAGVTDSSTRCFLDDPRFRLPPPPALLRRLGRGVPPSGRLLPADVDWIISDSCDNVPKSCTGGLSTKNHMQPTTRLNLNLAAGVTNNPYTQNMMNDNLLKHLIHTIAKACSHPLKV